MSGWCPSSSVCAAVEWRWGCAAVPPRLSGAARALLIPLQYWRVLLSCRLLLLAGCVVCGWCVQCVWCLCGGVSCVRSPLVVVVGGAVVDGGVALQWWVA